MTENSDKERVIKSERVKVKVKVKVINSGIVYKQFNKDKIYIYIYNIYI